MPLTVLKVRNAKPGRYTDGRGLCLVVKESGSRSWVLRIQRDGRRRDFGLGSAQDVSLAEARDAAVALRRKLREGIDPITERQSARNVIPNFEQAAWECYDALKVGWRNRRNRSWIRSLENHAFPSIGKMRVNEVNTTCVVSVLTPIWVEKPETSRKILQRINTVLDFAHVKGWIADEVSLRSVRKGLPRQSGLGRHYEAMPYHEVPAFIQRIAAAKATAGQDALCFTIYNGVRSGETRYAVWSEFNLDDGIWTIPSERMKTGEAHVVPLSSTSVALLRNRWKVGQLGSEFVFSKDGETPISNMTMIRLLRVAGYKHATVHGFRSAFTDWAAECTDIPKEVVDKALAHKIPNQVEAAYRRTDFFDKRRTLMSLWETYLTK